MAKRKKVTPQTDFLNHYGKAMQAVSQVDPDDFNLQMATVFEAMGMSSGVPKGSKPIPLTEIVAGGTNGVPELLHEKCGCPGLHGMMPTTTGDWYCDNCQGHVKKADAIPLLAKGKKKYQEFEDTVRKEFKLK